MSSSQLPYVLSNSSSQYPDANVWNSNFNFLNQMTAENLVVNGQFQSWTAGASSAPDAWTLSGSGAAVARDATNFYSGSYGCKLTYGSAALSLYQNSYETTFFKTAGRMMKAYAFVKCSTASIARVRISDGVGSADSSYHTGDGTWQLLTVTYAVSSSASYVRLECRVEAAGNATFGVATLLDYNDVLGLCADPMNNQTPALWAGSGFDGSGNLLAKTLNYAADGGSANAYTATLSPVPAAYVTGMSVTVKIANANTGASTLNVNSLGTKNIKVNIGATLWDPPTGYLQAGGIYTFYYDGTQFLIVGQSNTFWRAVGTSAPSAASSVTFSNLAPGVLYRLIVALRQNTSNGYVALRFNADSGNNYFWNDWDIGDGGGTAGQGSTSASLIAFGRQATPITAGYAIVGQALISTDPSDNTKVYVSMLSQSREDGQTGHFGGGRYNGGANLSSMTVLTSAGTMTGAIRLEALT